MIATQPSDLTYDPYDVTLNADPYPVYRRLRDESPLYYNEKHDFYAVSRAEDVERGLSDRETFSNARSDVLEFIKAGVEFPSGIFIFEDPPLHTIHRGLMSRVFTPKRVGALEPRGTGVLRARPRPDPGSGPVRLRPRSGRPARDAHDRHAARNS